MGPLSGPVMSAVNGFLCIWTWSLLALCPQIPRGRSSTTCVTKLAILCNGRSPMFLLLGAVLQESRGRFVLMILTLPDVV